MYQLHMPEQNGRVAKSLQHCITECNQSWMVLNFHLFEMQPLDQADNATIDNDGQMHYPVSIFGRKKNCFNFTIICKCVWWWIMIIEWGKSYSKEEGLIFWSDALWEKSALWELWYCWTSPMLIKKQSLCNDNKFSFEITVEVYLDCDVEGKSLFQDESQEELEVTFNSTFNSMLVRAMGTNQPSYNENANWVAKHTNRGKATFG